jgi:hypothetical protein
MGCSRLPTVRSSQLRVPPTSFNACPQARVRGPPQTLEKVVSELTKSKPDGYAVLIDDKSSPVGFWFAYAYIDRETAEETAKITKGRVQPIYFKP